MWYASRQEVFVCCSAGSRVGSDWSTNSKLYEHVNGEEVLQGMVTRRFPEVRSPCTGHKSKRPEVVSV
eukprot:215097-Pelagomonas_calceolata.AAC.4